MISFTKNYRKGTITEAETELQRTRDTVVIKTVRDLENKNVKKTSNIKQMREKDHHYP